jgi:hypothetical protein
MLSNNSYRFLDEVGMQSSGSDHIAADTLGRHAFVSVVTAKAMT